jgi:hypothetical protein
MTNDLPISGEWRVTIRRPNGSPVARTGKRTYEEARRAAEKWRERNRGKGLAFTLDLVTATFP